MAERPWMKFYPLDWLNCKELRRCSAPARALWIDMICMMHDGNPYGHLADQGGALPDEEIARFSGFRVAEYRRLLEELESKRVFDRNTDGVIVSRRMLKDEARRVRNTHNGSCGGNPNLTNSRLTNSVNHNGYPNGLTSMDNPALTLTLPSTSESRKGSAEGKPDNPLYERFHDLVAQWPHPDGVDDGMRIWIYLVDSADITSQNVDEVFEGLSHYLGSKKYAKGFRMRVDKWLHGRRWKDRPEPASEEDKWRA